MRPNYWSRVWTAVCGKDDPRVHDLQIMLADCQAQRDQTIDAYTAEIEQRIAAESDLASLLSEPVIQHWVTPWNDGEPWYPPEEEAEPPDPDEAFEQYREDQAAR